jgi:spermidine synthase
MLILKNLYLYFIVFVCGAAVLTIEILGTRILGPFYGVSLFLWSALITVTLIALSIGYAAGGRWADRGASWRRLCLIMSLAGAWILLIPWIKRSVLSLAEPFGLRFAVLMTSFVLFAPPLALLGMVSPYAIKLRARDLNEVGSTAGNIFAISTMASVISALLTGYFLIPNVGVRLLTLITGFVLLISASSGLTPKLNSKFKALVLMVILLTGALCMWEVPRSDADPDRGLLSVNQSPYGEIRVLDIDNTRYLLIDGGVHTMVKVTNLKSLFPYVAVMDLTRNFFDKPGKVLLIGLGGGSIVKNFAKNGWDVDAVEIDPVVTKIALKYFGLKPSEAKIFQMDGRRFLFTHKEKYDLIIMDAFGSSSIPFHLVSDESFGLIASRLKENGIFAINIEAVGWKDPILTSLATTLKEHFNEVLALPISEPPDTLGNIVLLASRRRQLDFPEEMLGRPIDYLRDNYMHWYILQMNHAWDNRFVPESDSNLILTDDLNSVDVRAEEINNIARKQLHSYFGQDGLSW